MEGMNRSAGFDHASDFRLVVGAMRRILRPLIRILLTRMTCSFLLEVVRRVYIEEAREHLLRVNNGKASVSELALLTGEDKETIESFERMQAALGSTVGGRDLRSAERIKESWEDKESLALRLDHCSESIVMERWRSDPRFSDESGWPRELPIYGKGSTFSTLVSVAAESGACVEELVEKLCDSGTTEVVDRNRIRACHKRYQAWMPNDRMMLESGSRALGRLAGTINHNFTANENDRLLQRDHWSLRLRQQDIDEVRRLCAVASERHLSEIDNIIERFETDESDGSQLVTFGVGCYHWFADPSGAGFSPQRVKA